MSRFGWAVALVLTAAAHATASPIIVEPDDYPPGADLSNPAPGVHLSTALNNNQPVPLFVVRSAVDSLRSTGTQVFSHVGIPFFNDIRRLRVDFDGAASEVTIDYISSGFFGTEFARLNVYGAGDVLLDSVVSLAQPAGTVQTLSITRPTADIKYAVAFSDGLTFGRFDFLRADVQPAGPDPGPSPVPEPATALLFAATCACGLGLWRRRATAV